MGEREGERGERDRQRQTDRDPDFCSDTHKQDLLHDAPHACVSADRTHTSAQKNEETDGTSLSRARTHTNATMRTPLVSHARVCVRHSHVHDTFENCGGSYARARARSHTHTHTHTCTTETTHVMPLRRRSRCSPRLQRTRLYLYGPRLWLYLSHLTTSSSKCNHELDQSYRAKARN